MKGLFRSVDFFSVIKYLFVFFTFVVFNHLENTPMPYSAAIYVAVLCQGGSLIVSSLLYLCSFLLSGAVGLLGSQALFCFFFIIITAIYKKFSVKMRIGFAAYSLIGLLSFVFLGDTANHIPLVKRVITTAITTVLTFLCVISAKAVNEKGLKFKFAFEEFFSVAILTVFFGAGVCNLISPYLWRGLSVFFILTFCFLYRTGIASLIASIFGISLSIYHGNVQFVSVFLLWGVVGAGLTPFSRYVAAFAVVAADYLIAILFGVYGGYTLIDFICVLSGCVAFTLIPNKLLLNLKEKLYSFREKQLVRQTINRNRLMLAGRLYDLSGVFTEMAGAFDAFKKSGISEDKAKNVMEKQILSSVCGECEYKDKCRKKDKDFKVGLSKIIDIGFAKGKLSLIDLPKEIGDVCLRPNNILFSLNKLLADFKSYAIENINLNNGREVIASQALGVAEILRGLAVESGAALKYQSRLERKLCNELYKAGFMVTELLIYGEDQRLSVSLVTAMKEFSITTMESVINKTLETDMELLEKTNITEDKCYLFFKRSAVYDAAYGLARTTKDGSDKCGDTYSVTRLSGDRLLVALSDGMGSGADAETISSTSLSLIESFYKAGLSSPLILNTVNKLLSINTEDNFTALDVSVIDLKSCAADFIKYGSPYGFIVGEGGIKIVEGNSLPLGIIDELKPAVCSAQLCDGDVIVLVTDGISDAFGSSGEIIDFLRLQTAKNPQTLADDILAHALKLNQNCKKDDMTALAVRIFKRNKAQ